MATPKKTDLSAPLLEVTGKEAGTLSLPKEAFGVTANNAVLSQYVRVYLANQRQGNASTKTRGEVIGSTKKIFKQKGTGRARHGSIKAPIFVGGGVAGGPRPRDYSLKMTKKQRKQALYQALTLQQKEKQVRGLSNDYLRIKPKTSVLYKALKAAGIEGKKTLVLVPKKEKNNLLLAGRNIPGVTFEDVRNINAYEVMRARYLLIVEDAVKVFESHFLKTK